MSFLPESRPRALALIVVAAFFIFAGVGHFTNAAFFIAIVPPYLPWPDALVYVSGVFEVLGGVGVLVPETRRRAGWGLLALLVAVYPANIHMALNPEDFSDISPAALYARLPMQFVFAALVWYAACMREDRGRNADETASRAAGPANEPAGVCLVTGVGPGTGRAIVERFAAHGYQVAMLARNAERLAELESAIPNAHAFVCDVTDAQSLAATVDRIRERLGPATVVVHNAVGGALGSYREIDPEVLEQNFQVNTMALLHLARLVTDDMLAAGGGALIATGNTAAYRGKAQFAGFAPSKAAQRILIESIAREVGPLGIHAVYLAIDAVIDLPWTRKRLPDAPDEFFCRPADIASEVFHLAHQPRSSWSSEQVIRPFGEPW